METVAMPDSGRNTTGLGGRMEPYSLQVRSSSYIRTELHVDILYYVARHGHSQRLCDLVRRSPGQDHVSEEWLAALDIARQGHIAKLDVLTLDVIMAPKDGLDRCVQ